MRQEMPVVFAGHGSPMNAVEQNRFSEAWRALGARLPRPRSILAVSAHWYTHGTRLCDSLRPRMIYDMYGFPEELYQLTYPAPGAPETARRAAELLGGGAVCDSTWGLDHGVWSILHWMYPDADIPVAEMSVDADASPEELFEQGRRLRPLREEGVLLLASGNVVHNLAQVNWSMQGGFGWADEFDRWVRDRVVSGAYEEVLRWQNAGQCAAKAFSTPEHFEPLLVALGAAEKGDRAEPYSDARTLGALSMTGYLFAGTGTSGKEGM